MKRIAISLFVLGLLLVAWFSLGTGTKRQPQASASVGQPAKGPAHIGPISPPVAEPTQSASENDSPEKSGVEVPPIEGSWAKELRELKELALKDPDAALAQVAQMSDKEERKAAAKDVCLLVSQKDPAKAMTAAWSLDLGKFADEAAENTALETLAKRWAEVDLVKSFAWASALPADEESRRDRVVKGIAVALSQIAPEEAARMVAAQINPESQVQMDAAMEVLRHWAAQDYNGAMDWVVLFPKGPFLELGIGELSKAKASQSPPETKPNH